MSAREEIVEVINKLFVFADNRDWAKLQSEVFAREVEFDMASMGGPKSTMTPDAICKLWQAGFEGIDYVNHLAGNYIIAIEANKANAFAYATATHYKEAATRGKTREFLGTYELELANEHLGWRITKFKYNLKFSNGNIDLS